MRRIGVLQVVKQRFASRVLRAIRQRKRKAQPELWREDENQWAHIWQARFYDFNVWTRRKQVEKLRYMHENPVQRGLVLEPGQWAWSSFRDYAQNHPGPVKLNQWPAARLSGLPDAPKAPPLQTPQGRGTRSEL